MLPPHLKAIKASLDAKGVVARSTYEDELLADLNEAEKALDKAKASNKSLTEGIEKRANARSGPIQGSCPTCGR